MRMLLKIFLVFLLIIGIAVVYIFNSPRPAAWMVNQLFKTSPAVAPENYEEILATTEIASDILYPSKFKDNTLDIISPKNHEGTLPTVIWIHGGAYVGGNKTDVTKYAVQIATNGYRVVSMNYELAPAAKYPTPLKQMAEVYEFVKENAKQYQFDLDQLYFAGDSAGAQIAAQFATLQTSSDYAKLIDLPQTVPAESIRGTLLFCGPFDIKRLSHMSDNRLVAFLLNRVGWAYMGERDWVNSNIAQQASPTAYVTKDFPPAFITDGNTSSFEAHGRGLAERLEALDVTVHQKFYEASLPHEYQFMMNTPEAFETLDAVIQFLDETKQNSATN